jgi:hypothetical protein
MYGEKEKKGEVIIIVIIPYIIQYKYEKQFDCTNKAADKSDGKFEQPGFFVQLPVRTH